MSMTERVDDGSDDDFRPSKHNRVVECWHCGDVYRESEARYETRPRFTPHTGPDTKLWWCRNDDCDGAGIGFDLHKTRKRARPKVTP